MVKSELEILKGRKSNIHLKRVKISHLLHCSRGVVSAKPEVSAWSRGRKHDVMMMSQIAAHDIYWPFRLTVFSIEFWFQIFAIEILWKNQRPVPVDLSAIQNIGSFETIWILVFDNPAGNIKLKNVVYKQKMLFSVFLGMLKSQVCTQRVWPWWPVAITVVLTWPAK